MVQLACQKTSGVDFISPEEIIDRRPVLPKAQEKGLGWRAETKRQKGRKFSFSVIPDSAFGLRFSPKAGKGRVAYYFVEADRSTMPIRRSNFSRSSYYKKMVGYWQSWQQKLFRKYFGFKNPRILTLTLSDERIQSMIQANKEVDTRGKGLRMFLFASERQFNLDEPTAVFRKVWVNGRGEKVSLID